MIDECTMAAGSCIISSSESCTRAIAQDMSGYFVAGDLLLLDGDLGSGKTHFVKGFAAGLGVESGVTSPTFSIANFYRTPTVELLHIDLYRLSSESEFFDLGLTDYFSERIVLIEWGGKFRACFDAYLSILFETLADGSRRLTLTAEGVRYATILETLRDKIGGISC